jgi:hypothetical protein
MKDFGDIRQIRNTLIKNLNNDIFFLKEKSDMLLEIDMETRIMIKSLGIREEEKWDKDINKYFMSDPYISL